MVDKVEVTVTDLEKKHKGKAGHENMYSVAKHVYMDNVVDTIGFAIEENLKILRAKIDAMLIDEGKLNKKNKPGQQKLHNIKLKFAQSK